VRRRPHAWLAAACSLPALAGCGGSTPHAAPATTTPLATVRTADCKLWRLISTPERQGLLAAFKQFFGRPVDPAHGHGAVLSDTQANRLFDGYCRQSFAGAFKLYKLYGRAVAFTAAPQ
jgi:hypothetical protein